MMKPKWWPVFERARRKAAKALKDAEKLMDEVEAHMDNLLLEYGKEYELPELGGHIFFPELKLALGLDRVALDYTVPHRVFLSRLEVMELAFHRGESRDSLEIDFECAVDDYERSVDIARFAQANDIEQKQDEVNIVILKVWISVLREHGDSRKVNRMVYDIIKSEHNFPRASLESVRKKIGEFKKVVKP